MRLRHKLLLLFAVFGIVPLLAMGAYDYVHSIRALDALIGAQTEQLATRASAELRDRLDLQESDIALLGGNEETQRYLRAVKTSDSPAAAVALERAGSYWRELWTSIRLSYERVALLDGQGRIALALSETSSGDVPVDFGPRPGPIRRPVLDAETAQSLGTLEISPRMAELTRSVALGTRFGQRGWSAIVDRTDGRMIRRLPDLPAGAALPLPLSRLTGEPGTVPLTADGSRWVVSWVNLEGLQWTVVAAASVDEFAGPFVRLRLLDLAILIAVVSAVTAAFAYLLHRSTRSLDALTLAADGVGAGDLSPALPPPGRDEVGRLSIAFRAMTARIREMIGQVEASRQTAVLGRFAAELSHEVRNPLTAIKINLQGLERDARDGLIPESSRQSVAMALREIRRLDDAVRAALRAGSPAATPRPLAMHEILTDSVTLLRPQASAQGIGIACRLDAPRDDAIGDAEGLRGAFVNILLNAIEAMPHGGAIRVVTSSAPGDTIAICIADDGPGIPAELRDRIFKPFFTTKDGGTGLGLSLALQTVRAHGGSLALGDVHEGTEITMTLPLQAAPVGV